MVHAGSEELNRLLRTMDARYVDESRSRDDAPNTTDASDSSLIQLMSSPVERASSMVEACASATAKRTDLGMRAWKMAVKITSASGDSVLSVVLGRLDLPMPVQVEHCFDKRRDDA